MKCAVVGRNLGSDTQRVNLVAAVLDAVAVKKP